ncbi:hypothetical protein [uncultured Flavobacterium sp.]|uniref:hypothetical protein n=1 Tax=uncultured Flavobacterium sp. TaxID=165435 RepID=UPI0025950E95|nr:hypothetical protein [uncultured Flavobacterium sp.]
MKEYIEKEKVMETITNLQGNININRRDLYNVIDSLPTTNNQYEVGGIYEFSND